MVAEIGARWLLCRVGARLFALPLQSVVEILRPLPVEPVVGAPAFVMGLSLLRGAPTPVIDAEILFGGTAGAPTRLIVLGLGERTVALAVDEVVGLRTAPTEAIAALPPLLSDADPQIVDAIARLDQELALVLNSGKIAPDSMFEDLRALGAIA